MCTPRLAPPTSTAKDSPTVGLSPSCRLGTSQSPAWSSTPATALKSLAPRSRPFSTANDLAARAASLLGAIGVPAWSGDTGDQVLQYARWARGVLRKRRRSAAAVRTGLGDAPDSAAGPVRVR